MRMGVLAAGIVALVAAGDAGAQRVVTAGPGAAYPAPGARVGSPMPAGTVVGQAPRAPGSRWGSKVDGRWWAGANAPGGWRAYRHQQRGQRLPVYWTQPNFTVTDWADYGLGQPPVGYSWTRYYDDAVLIDDRGQVYDWVDGVNWDGAGYGDGYVQPTYGQSTYAPAYSTDGRYAATAGYPPQDGYGERGYDRPGYVERRNSGVGGAVVGAAVGGVAGNVIAGRGNRLAGTLIGAGVGGAAGYAIDRSHGHRIPVAPRQPYDAPPYGAPGAGYAPPPPPPPPPPVIAPPPPPPAGGVWHSPDGGTTISTTSVGGYAGGSTTVVTVQTAPVVTTTTTEIVEDHVTWSHHPVRHKWVRRPVCYCR